ncbi:outer membrane protein assembly factor BamE [Catenovulum sediminis]|uniref:Outer membrane protein assembly factor BamE n=1 Tax=Catenovulum sediminis TaxID=1740262 RepID=A0ABV1REN6_9ALTE|nr:outer membrane protein assembly factor BamE [Catenovulum sediminis]
MKLLKLPCISLLMVIALSACAYRIDIRQGNYIEQKDVAKLRQNMSKEQVAFVLGNPVIDDSFNSDTWYYLYHVNYGDGREPRRIELTLQFENNQLQDMVGSIEKPENFTDPIDQ